MSREIVLDTETTGFDPRQGHRMVEIGCIELDGLLPTGRTFHTLINPERHIDDEVIRVHGVTNEKVRDAPCFRDVADQLHDFIGDAPVVAHNAGFDRAFVNYELGLCGRLEIHVDRWVDTLGLAQKRFPGMANSLDALCKRFKISLAERTLHGALIDARLLASVYLELKGGKERVLDLSAARGPMTAGFKPVSHGERPRSLPERVSPEEAAAHAAFLQSQFKDLSLWRGYGVEAAETAS